ncbi:MAG: hypothetical protein ABIT37_03350 [Luteolibacter sp.]
MSDFPHESDNTGSPLPRWQEGEIMRFVTFRLEDAVLPSRIRQMQEDLAIWNSRHPKPWMPLVETEYHRRFTWKLEAWLDEGVGSCLMSIPARRAILEELLMCFQGDLVEHHAWVIMPNHVHLIFTPIIATETLVKTWKNLSAHRIGRGNIWQEKHRDMPIRGAGHFADAVRYIRRNPFELRDGTYTFWQGTSALAVE